MTERRLPPPRSISPEARRFLENAPALVRRSCKTGSIGAIRKASFDIYAPAGLIAARELGVSVREEKVAGLRTQVVTPPNADGRSAILYFFGGAYVQGSPDEDLEITAQLASLTGRVLYAPYYRLAPEHPHPAALEDALKVYRELLRTIGSSRLTVSGESAGGGLALLALLAAHLEGLQFPAKLALMSPWADLSATGDSVTTLSGIEPTMDYEMTLEPAVKAFAGSLDPASPSLSPVYADFPGTFPPTLITTGTRDLFLSDCARLSTRMRASGISAELRVWEGMWHVFEFYQDIPEAQRSLAEIAAFINA